jgi:hypothetical protein
MLSSQFETMLDTLGDDDAVAAAYSLCYPIERIKLKLPPEVVRMCGVLRPELIGESGTLHISCGGDCAVIAHGERFIIHLPLWKLLAGADDTSENIHSFIARNDWVVENDYLVLTLKPGKWRIRPLAEMPVHLRIPRVQPSLRRRLQKVG